MYNIYKVVGKTGYYISQADENLFIVHNNLNPQTDVAYLVDSIAVLEEAYKVVEDLNKMDEVNSLVVDYDNALKVVDYENFSDKTNTFPEDYELCAVALGLSEEVGELHSVIVKMMRGDYKLDDIEEKSGKTYREKALREAGDVVWYLTQICHVLGFTLEEAMQANMIKLQKRYVEKKIAGEGDYR